jgi:hypothetical protein
VWDCPIEVKIFNPQIGKLVSKMIHCYFIIYSKKSKGYRFYCPNCTTKFTDKRHAVFLACDVSFVPREIDLEKILNHMREIMNLNP